MPRRYAPLAIVLLTVVLLASGCARPAAPMSRTPSVAPTATPPPLVIAPAHPIVWTKHQLPPGLKLTMSNWDGPALAHSDGDTAYLCDLANGQAQVWATHDRAAHWTMAGSVPVASGVTSCDITVDAFQSRQALLRTYAPDGQCCAQETGEFRTYLTADGGAIWVLHTAPSEATPKFASLATVGGVSYALASTRSHSHCIDCYSALFMSKDGMRTWTRIDADIFLMSGFHSERFISRFWPGSSGELLAQVTNNVAATTFELWRSGDQGAHWIQIGMARGGTVYPLIVADGQGQRFWRGCAAYQTLGDYTHPPVQQISCTIDGGKTWVDTGGDNSYHINIFAQATDGALLGVTPNPFRGEPASTLLRVTPGQNAWESLGALPVGDAPQEAAETLWLLKRPANYGDALTTIFTATYP